jgi:hypothetical protein
VGAAGISKRRWKADEQKEGSSRRRRRRRRKDEAMESEGWRQRQWSVR